VTIKKAAKKAAAKKTAAKKAAQFASHIKTPRTATSRPKPPSK
jgi:hypothetical protein